MLQRPVVLATKALKPTAVLSAPVVLANKEHAPNAVLLDAVRLFFKAS